VFHVDDVPPIANRPRRAVRILFSHELLDVTWSVFGGGERGAEPHVHRDHVDAFYVGPGTWMAAAPGKPHALANAGDERASILNVRAPDAGFAETLRR
jgi:hypothetical protein